MDGKMAVTQRVGTLHPDDKQHVFQSTQDTGREHPLVTTAPPFTDLNHHLQFKTISQPDPHYQSQEQFKGNREIDHHFFKALSGQLVHHEDEDPFSDVATGTFSVHTAQLTPGTLELSGAAGETQRRSSEELSAKSLTTNIMPTSTPPPCRTVPEEQLGRPHAASTHVPEGVTTLVMREEGEKSKSHKGPMIDANAVTLSGDQDDETTTTTIFTTTIITTIQTPGNITCTMMSQPYLIDMPLYKMPLTKHFVIVQLVMQRGERQNFFSLCHHTNARV